MHVYEFLECASQELHTGFVRNIRGVVKASIASFVALLVFSGCATSTDRIPEADNDSLSPTTLPDQVDLSGPGTSIDSVWLIGVDTRGQSWYVGQDETSREVCIVSIPEESSNWVAACGMLPEFGLSTEEYDAMYQSNRIEGDGGEYVGETITIYWNSQ